MSFQCCGRPQLSAAERANHDAQRLAFLIKNGPQAAAAFDYIYGYGTSDACGRDISYYRQFDAANGDHCRFAHYADRAQQIDQYRGLNCRSLRGWDKRMQNVTEAAAGAVCCSVPGSCNGILPYPYAQPRRCNCSAEAQEYSNTDDSCFCTGGRQYPHAPYPAAYYMQAEWPYGETAPTKTQVEAIEARQTCTTL